MAAKLELQLSIKTNLSQRMQLAVKILQMNTHELERHLEQEALENPLIDLDLPKEEVHEGIHERLKKLEWLDKMDKNNASGSFGGQEEKKEKLLGEKPVGECLEQSLLLQLSGLGLSRKKENIVRYLIASLDENGYLSTPVAGILQELGCDDKGILEECIALLQQFEPWGVGAFDLRQCLLMQAQRAEPVNPVLIRLITDYLDHFSQNRLDKLAREMGVCIETLKQAKEQLLSLNPKPGNGKGKQETVPYIRPDLFLLGTKDGFELIYSELGQSRVEINSYYRSLLKGADEKTAAYLREKLAAADNLIWSINQRKNTVVQCAQAILNRQEPFFHKGPGHLLPMTLQDIAQDIGVHPSTVSRAVRDKYLQSRWGVHPLGYFFSRGVSKDSQEKSQDMVTREMKKIIAGESAQKPLSDQKIAQLLADAGMVISRRTVTKYRECAHIPCAAGRRQF